MSSGVILAKEIRARLGDRLITHTEWGSRFPYSSKPSSWSPKPDKIATHHHGYSAQLPRQPGTRAGAIAQMKYVDRIHFVTNGWAHGFAYGFAILKGGFIGEGRSFWYPWGAHVGDVEPDGIKENLEAIPVYWAVGIEDGEPDLYPPDMWEAADALYPLLLELGGIEPHALIGHKDIQPTSCPGKLYPLVQDWKISGYRSPIAPPAGVKPPDLAIDRIFAQGLARPPDGAAYWKGLSPFDPQWGHFKSAVTADWWREVLLGNQPTP